MSTGPGAGFKFRDRGTVDSGFDWVWYSMGKTARLYCQSGSLDAITIDSAGRVSTPSSRRWKTNIQPLQAALSKVKQLRGVSYELKEDSKHNIGLIAEEVGEVIPEVVTYEETGKDALGLDYGRLVAVLIEAVKEQQQQIEELKMFVQSHPAEVNT